VIGESRRKTAVLPQVLGRELFVENSFRSEIWGGKQLVRGVEVGAAGRWREGGNEDLCHCDDAEAPHTKTLMEQCNKYSADEGGRASRAKRPRTPKRQHSILDLFGSQQQ
jgi:hypothetical protein